MAFESYGQIGSDLATNLSKKFRSDQWLCVVGAAEYYNSSIIVLEEDPRQMQTYLLGKWKNMYITIVCFKR